MGTLLAAATAGDWSWCAPLIGSDTRGCLSDLLVPCDASIWADSCLKTLTEIRDPFVEDISIAHSHKIFSRLLESETFRQTDALPSLVPPISIRGACLFGGTPIWETFGAVDNLAHNADKFSRRKWIH